ncbi:MAG: ATP-grasp domain-containing protein, partial [Chromatiaceae bacterium]
MADVFPFPVARIGIVGGGQLGRMMVKAAKRLGCTCVVLDPTPGSPAGQVSGHQIVGDYHDPAKLRELVESSTVTTFDIEDIDADTLVELAREGRPIHPLPQVLAIVQDKLQQKRLLSHAGIPTAEYVEIRTPSPEAFAAFGYPLVQKARRGGYDGRGVSVMRTEADFRSHLPVASLVERFVVAEKEIAVLVARGLDGDCRCYPPVEMIFRPGENVLDMLLALNAGLPGMAALFKTGGLFIFSIGTGFIANINYSTIGRMYRDRLMEAFLPDDKAIRSASEKTEKDGFLEVPDVPCLLVRQHTRDDIIQG